MGFEKLSDGDIIIEMHANKPSHSLMWVGGPSPLVHATESEKGFGVRQHSSQYLALKVLNGGDLRVYRQNTTALANKAAIYAGAWATDTTRDASSNEFVLLKGAKQKYRVLKTPFSITRLEAARQQPKLKEWGVESLFRVIKAIANENENVSLSPNNGVSCSQFVTYCYQAAALKEYVGTVIKPGEAPLKRNESPVEPEKALEKWNEKHGLGNVHYWREKQYLAQKNVFASLKKQEDLVSQALSEYLDETKEIIPTGLRVDAKTQSVEKLKKSLDESDVFGERGKVVVKCTECNTTYLKPERIINIKETKICNLCNKKIENGGQLVVDVGLWTS